MKKLSVVVCTLVLLAAAAVLTMAHAQESTTKLRRLSPAEAQQARQRRAERRPNEIAADTMVRLDEPIDLSSKAPRAFGTITYDTLTISFVPSTLFRSYGNQFNTALNPAGTAVIPVQPSGSITKLTWGVWGTTTATNWGTFWVTIYGPVAGTSAPILSSLPFTGLGGSAPIITSFTLTSPVGYTGPSFLVGLLNFNTLTAPPYNGPCPVLGAGTVGGQGFHGMGINFTTPSGTGFAPLTSLNAIMRASGNVLVPVELMSFSVE